MQEREEETAGATAPAGLRDAFSRSGLSSILRAEDPWLALPKDKQGSCVTAAVICDHWASVRQDRSGTLCITFTCLRAGCCFCVNHQSIRNAGKAEEVGTGPSLRSRN